MPKIGALSCGYADNEVPADRVDERLEDAIQDRADEIMADEDMQEILAQHGSTIPAYRINQAIVLHAIQNQSPINSWAKDRVWAAAVRMYDALRPEAERMAREELQK